MMRTEILSVLAHTAGMLRAGIPLVDSWETILKEESGAEGRKFLELLLRNWKTLPYDESIRITPTMSESCTPEDLLIFGPMTFVGEATGLLDTLWPGAIAFYLIRNKLSQGASPAKEDIELFLSLLYAFSPEDLSKLNWKSWSRDPSWQNLDLKAEPEFNPDRISLWFQKNRRSETKIKDSVKAKFMEVGEASGCLDLVDAWVANLENLLRGI